MKRSWLNSYLTNLINWPKLWLALTLMMTLMLSFGIKHLQLSSDFREYFSADNPQLNTFEEFEEAFSKSNNVSFVIEAKNQHVFTKETLSLIEKLTEDAWLLPYAVRVSSIANFQKVSAIEDDVLVESLYTKSQALNEQQINAIKKYTLAEKQLVEKLISKDGRYTAIFVILDLPKEGFNATLQVTEQAEALKQKYQKFYPQVQIDIGGSTTFNSTLTTALTADLMTLVPISYILIFMGLWYFLRRTSALFAIYILTAATLTATFGFFGWLGQTLTQISGFIPTILLSIMIADSVHILTSYFHFLEKDTQLDSLDKQQVFKKKQQAIVDSLKMNFKPVLITSVTTIIGFLSLNYSDSPPYRLLGNMIAFGVFLALVLSLTLLPVLMLLLPYKCKTKKQFKKVALLPLANWVIQHKKLLIIVLSILSVWLLFSVPKNRISDNWATYFDDSFPFMQMLEKVDGNLSGINIMEYSLKSKAPEGVDNPEYLKQVDQFSQWLQQQEKVVHVSAYTDVLKNLNQVMHGDALDWYRTPDSSALAAQYFLFYELSLPEGLGLTDVVDISKTQSRITVSTTKAGSDFLLALDQKAQQWLLKNAPLITPTQATGLGMVFAYLAQRNIQSLLQGTAIALVLISLMMIWILKSLKYGLLSLIPNLIPAIMAYGIWGQLLGYIDISLSIVGVATLGIVVDDTIHFLYKYLHAKRQLNLATDEAIRYSFNTVGLALVTTSVVLVLGFLVLLLSHSQTSQNIGLLMAITLTIALMADFLLLPAVLSYFDQDK